jgi:hypothetical protein
VLYPEGIRFAKACHAGPLGGPRIGLLVEDLQTWLSRPQPLGRTLFSIAQLLSPACSTFIPIACKLSFHTCKGAMSEYSMHGMFALEE